MTPTAPAAAGPISAVRARRRVARSWPGALALAALFVSLLLILWVERRQQEAQRWTSHSIVVREGAERLLGVVRDAETAQRGYLLTGDAAFLTPSRGAGRRAAAELDSLRALTADNVAQQRRLAETRTLLAAKLDELARSVALYDAGRPTESVALARRDDGRRVMERLRLTLAEFKAEESRLLEQRQRAVDAQRALSRIALTLALLSFLATLAYQARDWRLRRREMSQRNADLEAEVAARTQDLELERLRVEALLADVNHRVGNELAAVAMLLGAQARRAAAGEVRDALDDAQRRIHGIAAAQRRMRLNADDDTVAAAAFFTEMLNEVRRTLPPRIALKADIAGVALPGRTALSLAIMVNELIVNAVKHGFPHEASGVVHVTLEPHGDGLALRVADDGVGMATALDATSLGLGRGVVGRLARSLRGEIRYAPCHPDAARPGTCVTLTLPSG